MRKIFQFNEKKFKMLLFLLLIPVFIFASENGERESITHLMTNLVIELGIIIFAARLGGIIAEKLKFPGVLGELLMGIIIGPYMLGGIGFIGFEHGLFSVVKGSSIPVSQELYGIATVASIILLFSAGLETDFNMFIRYSLTGLVLGIGGVVASFLIGAGTAVLIYKISFMDPRALFLGAISTATSVGITARILSEHRKMDSPEGVSIMAGAVIDDILGIIVLAVVIGIYTASKIGDGHVEWSKIGLIAIKAVGVWLLFTSLGIIFAKKISSFLKKFKSITVMSILSLGLSFILAGIFEKSGLALIVGAYVMGLSLSRTDLSFVIHDKLHTLQSFFIPVFFTVMGMLVNPFEFANINALKFGILYTIGAIIAKIIGCGGPAYLLNFNSLGALRIGVGMVPRGEVALIIAGIGLSYGILDNSIFGASIMMTLLSTLIAPPIFNYLIKINKAGTLKVVKVKENVITRYEFPSNEITEIFAEKLVRNFSEEGFYVNLIQMEAQIYHINKDDISIIMEVEGNKILFESDKSDVNFIKNVVYETLLYFTKTMESIKDLEKPENMRKEITSVSGRTDKNILKKLLDNKAVIMELKGKTKEEVIRELCATLYYRDFISDEEKVFQDVMEREKIISTGLEKGIAIPHAKSDAVDKVGIAIGIKHEGIDFGSPDGQPSKIICLIVSPKNEASAHLQIMSMMTSIFINEENRKKILSFKKPKELIDFLTKDDKPEKH